MLRSPQPVVSVQDVHVSYDDVRALNGLTLELYAGEMFGLFGPNGAGKTTLIQSLAGRRNVDRGSVRFALKSEVNARSSTGTQPSKSIFCDESPTKWLGIVPQEIAVYPDLTVHQNLMVFGRLHGLRGSVLRGRVDEALHWSNLEQRSRSLAATLSGGMQRRLNIACSVLHEPSILLLDEPTVGVDPQSRERIYDMLSSLAEGGTAILLTTHQLDEVQHRCDRIAVMDQGRIIAQGRFSELLEQTIGLDPYVRLRFRDPQTTAPEAMRLSADQKVLTGPLQQGSRGLARLLSRYDALGVMIEHVEVQQPTLQNLFLHLTGRELRE